MLGVRSFVVASLGMASIIGPTIVIGDMVPWSSAQALAGTPRASAALAPTEFSAIPAALISSTALPKQMTSGGTKLTPAALNELATRAAKLGANGSKAALPACSGQVDNPSAGNGRLNVHDLCVLPWTIGKSDRMTGALLRGDAALSLARLNAAYFTEFGSDLCVRDAYRSYDEQVETKKKRPGKAAPAGASNHGWALAVDLNCGVEVDSSDQWKWLDSHAPAYGWQNPDWARANGKGPHEPWHWELAAEVAKIKALQAAGKLPTPVIANSGN